MIGGGDRPGGALRSQNQASCATLLGFLSLSGLSFPELSLSGLSFFLNRDCNPFSAFQAGCLYGRGLKDAEWVLPYYGR